MKHTKSFIVCAVALITSSAAIARDRGWWENLYVGADAQVRRMDFKGGFGDNLLQHHSPQGNIYAGLKFKDCMGIELGYEATSTRTRAVTLTTGDIAAGMPITTQLSPIVFKTKAKIKGPHVDLVGFYSPDEKVPVQLLGAIGVSILKGTYERRTLIASGMPGTMVRTLSAHKMVMRLTGGVQYMLDENLGVRVTTEWVNTGKMVIFANDGIPSSPAPEIKPKNSTVYGLGMLWVF